MEVLILLVFYMKEMRKETTFIFWFNGIVISYRGCTVNISVIFS